MNVCHSSVSKESACNAEDLCLIPRLGRSPGEGNSNPLQYSCLENPTDRGAWWITVHGATKESDTNLQLSNNTWKIPVVPKCKLFLCNPTATPILAQRQGHKDTCS